MIKIREAVAADAAAIISFQKEMAWETEQYDLEDSKVIPGVNTVFEKPALGKYYVAEDNNRIIASLLMTYEWSDWRNANVWWFQSVYVIPEFRRRGVFSVMYEHVKKEAESRGVAGLRLYVESSNNIARNKS